MTKRVPAEEVSYGAEDGCYYYRGKPFTGTTYTEYPEGTPRSELEYREGLRWGRSRGWYDDGALSDESEWYRDVLHGTARERSPSGVLLSESVCEYGIALSKREWDEEGHLLEEYRLHELDSNFALLQKFRQLYGADET